MPLRSFRLSLRFILPLALVLALFAYAVVPLVDEMTLRWFVRDLDARSQMLASALHEPLAEYVPEHAQKKITQLFDRSVQDGRLFALAFCDPTGKLLYRTATYPQVLGCRSDAVGQTDFRQSLVDLPGGTVHVTESRLMQNRNYLGKLVLVHDMSYIEHRSAETRRYVIVLFALLAVVVSLITVFVAHLSWRGWVDAVKGILKRGGSPGAASL
jgi:hypothetical protein